MPQTLNKPGLPDDAECRSLLLATGASGGVALVATAVPLVSSLAPSERARALGGVVELDIADIPPGGMKTVEWRANRSGWCAARPK
jgi:ubiquinol-cytochrome c reductase iron-sulfur subunit